MVDINDSPLWVDGTLDAGNILAGTINITPVANAMTSVSVTGLTLTGTGNLYVQLTPKTSAPAARAGTTTGVRTVSVDSQTSTSFNAYIYRTNTTQTGIFWIATRNAS